MSVVSLTPTVTGPWERYRPAPDSLTRRRDGADSDGWGSREVERCGWISLRLRERDPRWRTRARAAGTGTNDRSMTARRGLTRKRRAIRITYRRLRGRLWASWP